METVIRKGRPFWPSLVLLALPIGLNSFGAQHVSNLLVEELSSDSAAAKAGIQLGDRVIRYDGKLLSSPAAFDALQENTFGKKDVVLQIRRSEATLSLTLPLGSLGLKVRPELPPDAEKLYEEGKASLKAGDVKAAIAHWEASAELMQAEDKAGAAWLDSRAGEALEGQGHWKDATEAHRAAWELLKDGSDAAAQSRTLSALGRCSRLLNDFPAAQTWFEEGRKFDLRAGNELWVAGDLSDLGNLAKDRGNSGELRAAKDYHRQALEIRERLAPGSLLVASSLNGLGNVANHSGDLEAAQDYYARSLAIQERLAPDSLELAGSLNNLGNIARERGDLESAQDYLKRALAIKERLAPGSRTLANSVSNLASIFRKRGDLQAAEEYGRRSLQIYERLAPNSLQVADDLLHLGQVAGSRGDFQAAADYIDRALSIQERLAPNSLSLAETMSSLGIIAFEGGDLKAASDYQTRCLRIVEQIAPGSLQVAGVTRTLGNIAFARGDLTAAQDYESRALNLDERLAPESVEVEVDLSNLAQIAFERSDLTAAQDYQSRALKIGDRFSPDSTDLADILTNFGYLALKEHHLSDAQSLFARAVTAVESQRGRILSADARALFVAKYRSAYEGLVEIFLALNDVPAALSTSERARSRSLLDLLTEARVDIRQGIEPTLLERERHLQESLNAKAESQTRLLSGKHTEQEAAAVAKEINVMTTEYHEIQATIRGSSPHYAALTQPQPLSLEQIQQQVLDKNSLLLEYSLGDDASALFAVTQDSIKSYRLPKRKEIEALARQSYEALTARNQHIAAETAQQRNARILQAETNYPKLATQLSYLILAPAVAELGTKRLLIVADGDLLQIPFGVLTDPAASSPQPLIVNHEIVSLPSASVITVQRRELSQRKPAAKQLALFADPVFEPGDERVRAFSNLKDAKTQPEMASGNVTRDISFERAISESRIGDDRSKIQRLPFSREEANAIFSYTQPSDALKALDFDASKSTAIGSEMSQYRIVHFATHALLNNDHPELSGIVLSLVDRQGHGVDGFLRLNEIYNLNLPADLVVLSACQTGLGKQIRGEGLIGLTRGFMYAGAQRVVASLWKVDDEATSELMGRFYEKMLKEGEPAAAALRHAEIEMSQQNRWHAAYFWAGFQLQGEWK